VDLDLSVPEILIDPLISQLNEADGIDVRSFAQLLESAARVLATISVRAQPGPADELSLPLLAKDDLDRSAGHRGDPSPCA
jgi:hypothetical protein